MEWAEIIAIIAIVVSGVFAIITTWVSIKSFRKSTKALAESQQTQDKMLKIEQAREHDRQLAKQSAAREKQSAALTTEKLKHKSGYYILNINNFGSSEARNIKVTLDDKPLSEFPNINPDPDANDTIGHDSTLPFRWKTSHVLSPPFKAKISWSDDSGEDGLYETTLVHPA